MLYCYALRCDVSDVSEVSDMSDMSEVSDVLCCSLKMTCALDMSS